MGSRRMGPRWALGIVGLGILLGPACSGVGVMRTDRGPVNADEGPIAPLDGGLVRAEDDGFRDALATTRFLTQTTFGPTRGDVIRYPGTSASAWFRAQLAVEPGYLLDEVDRYRGLAGGEPSELLFGTTNYAFWIHAVHGEDQLRQRMAFALSQILVVSNGIGDELTEHPDAVSYFQDQLIEHAFGNYRDVLEEVTYSPAMGIYLTYLGSQRANPETGQVPDENYAREILQLFSIGVVELEADGTPRLDENGQTIETYDNRDVTGLAKVFTGLGLDFGPEFENEANVWRSRLVPAPNLVSVAEKSFLGQTIPAGTPSAESIGRALDIIFAHPNVGPFLSRQLIQRFVTSDPRPEYVARVAAAFDAGTFTLPDGDPVGTGQRGDLAATLAALLFDPEARSDRARQAPGFGKLREPALRLSHFLRAFGADARTPEFFDPLFNLDAYWGLSQHPYRAPSVFNFYRPGYVAPGTRTGNAGMTVPELQIINATTIPGDANFMERVMFGQVDVEGVAAHYRETHRWRVDEDQVARTFVADYGRELGLIDDPVGLVDDLDRFLCFGSLTDDTKAEIAAILQSVAVEDADGADVRELRVRLAVWMVMHAPEYLVQR